MVILWHKAVDIISKHVIATALILLSENAPFMAMKQNRLSAATISQLV